MNYNDLIEPLDRVRTGDDFADSMAIAEVSSLGEPALVVTDSTLTFASGMSAIAEQRAVVISSDSTSLAARALIGTLTSLDAARVFNFQGTVEELVLLRNEIWQLSHQRGDYDELLATAPESLQGHVGLLLSAAQKNIVAIIDGADAYAAALLAQRLAFRCTQRILAAQPPTDPAAQEAQKRLRLPMILAAPVPKNAGVIALNHLMKTLELSR